MADKILIVDDDVDTIHFLSLILSQQGFQIITAKNGTEGLALAKSDRPDLIVLDVMMPDVDGFQVARILRSQSETSNTPILMYTAKSQIDDKVAGYEAGVDFYLSKPVHPIELQANIKALIKRRRSTPGPVKERGYTVGVVGARGGLGVSTLALNLAVSYNMKTKAKVIAAETRPGQGTWAMELNLLKQEGLANLLRMSQTDISQGSVEKQLVSSVYGVHLLLSSNKSGETDLITATGQLETIIDQMACLSKLLVLDIGTTYLLNFFQVAEHCDELIIVVEPNPVTARRTRLLLDELNSAGFSGTKLLTVVMVNRARNDVGLSLSQLEDIIGQNVALGIPPTPELAYQASLRGTPLVLIQPGGLISQQFFSLADRMTQRITR